MGEGSRFRLTRCGVVNVWQYDRQVFDLADGRLLLRGANGAGKSKTMEMILPFAIDGDKARLTASGRHHTSLLWLLLDGYEGQARTGYVWVEFSRTNGQGDAETVTCGVGMRATQSARQATAWYFTSSRRVGVDLHLEDESGPLSRQQLEAEVTGGAAGDASGHVFDQAVRYREHVGQRLFGLPGDQYDDLLRLIYWLRQPQVGEDIDPKRLAEQLVNALPQVDDAALRTAGDTFDELEAFGEGIERRARAAHALRRFVDTYASYARCVVHERGIALLEADATLRRRTGEVRRVQGELTQTTEQRDATHADLRRARQLDEEGRARIGALESGPEARARARLLEMGRTVEALGAAAAAAERHRQGASGRADRSARAADDEGSSVAEAASDLAQGLSGVVRSLDDVGAAVDVAVMARTGGLVGAGEALRWADGGAVDVLEDSLRAAGSWVTEASASVTRRQAAVTVVRAALEAADEARRGADEAGARESDAQGRVDEARALLADAGRVAQSAEEEFEAGLARWHAAAGGPGLVLPAFELPALDPDGLRRLDGLARAAVSGTLDELSTAAARAESDAEIAAGHRAALVAERAEVAGRVDPEPEAPRWVRDPREARAGAPFWRLVDFADHLDAPERAGLEAALEGAGVLDAWVGPDGRVDGERLDVQIASGLGSPLDGVSEGPPHEGGPTRGQRSDAGTLAQVLRVDAASTDVPAAVVAAVLDRVGLLDLGAADVVAPAGLLDAASPAVAVGADGSWQAGPVRGRTTKDTAQYVGAAARAAERRRRLDRLDEAVNEAEARRDDADTRARSAREHLGRVRAWLAAMPSHDGVMIAWATLEERESRTERLEAERAQLADEAHHRRAGAATRHEELLAAGDTHGLPVTVDGLRARDEELRTIRSELELRSRAVPALERTLARWLGHAEAARADAGALAASVAEAEAADAEWASRRHEHEVLVAAEGASVAELEAQLATLRRQVVEHRAATTELSTRHGELVARVGGLGATLEAAHAHVEHARPELDSARAALAALDDLPGVATSAFGVEGFGASVGSDSTPDTEAAQATAVEATAEGAASGDEGVTAPASEQARATASKDRGAEVARPRWPHLATMSVAAVRRLVAAMPMPGESERARNAILQAFSELKSGEAAVHEPRLLDDGGVLVAVGRDDLGDLPVVDLHQRLDAAVAKDRELLTARERKLFEDHVLGQLGDALRAVRRKADELVHAMNEQLRDVTTSQGIRVRLRWRLRDDIAVEARRAVALLGQPLGALLPDEKTELRESLHRLIDVSRAEAPEEPYAVHLARALDYRQWNAFTVQYHRPETGDWRDLQRRTALSQGEQKVLCYLPLFAAAAAHFTSVAGAAPHAPRFVLLDDAFPKIDVRTHPLLFGLLVDLDLDFIITSERLWGTHATVPRLAIYEALRSPGERGIAQYQHRWDGQRLTAVGV